jgi:cytochrome c oxidase cbb3-type subunit 4
MFTYETLASFAQTWGTVGFCILFALAGWYALNPKNSGVFDEAARLPLEKD